MMKIEEVDTGEDLWTTLLEHYVKISEFAVMHCSAMSESAAFALAKRLDISVKIRGDEYLFTASKQAMRLLQNADESRH